MVKSLLIILMTLTFFICNGQTLRYFEFRTECGHGNWQDTSFIAATSNTEVIDSVLANLQRPYNERKFISGPITYGHGGHNRNASHWFSWHFIPNDWILVEMAIEICDGCPFSDVDSDTAYWIGNIGRFCPWSGRPVREVTNPSTSNFFNYDYQIELFPNPAKDLVYVNTKKSNYLNVIIYNTAGQVCLNPMLNYPERTIHISSLKSGIYYLKIIGENFTVVSKLIVE